MSIAELNDRTRQIFREIVESYLTTGEPVGSRTLSRVDGIAVSPATIRNVMADLEDMGLIQSPHTSAGRVPTDMGLRFFVDGLMQIGDLTSEERAAIDAQCAASGRSHSDVFAEASRTLSGLSQLASVIMVPREDLRVKHIEFVALSPGKAIVVLVADDGRVENRLIDVPMGMTPAAMTQASNYLNARLAGRGVDEVAVVIRAEIASHQAELDALAATLVEAGLASWSGTEGGEAANLIVSGQARLLEDGDAVADLERMQRLFDDLERGRDLIKLLDLARAGEGVRMFIGAENNLFSLSGSSLIAAPYMNNAKKIVGVVGVIGPTRLNYARIIPMVDYTARAMSRLLG